ncbi:MAG: ectonucleotide pyrophosphatase/phosphodiesterase [Chitinophagaceae bacterium]
MRKIAIGLFLLSLYCHSFSQSDPLQQVVSNRSNSIEQQKKPYVILISADGFRYDYAEKYQAGNLLALSNSGVRAASMIPSYPSLTFPNHYSLVTGLYPSHHGIVSNYFYDKTIEQVYSMKGDSTVGDGKWYGGTPLWVLAEQQQMLTASFYWIGSEAAIQQTRPTYYYKYESNESFTIDQRIQVVVNWLQLPVEKRPHLITFYISDVDHAGHTYGPDAPETREAVLGVDAAIGKMVKAVSATGLPVNFIFLADHGMTRIDTSRHLFMPAVVDSSKFVIPRGLELVALYAKNKKDILPLYQQLKKQEKYFKTYLPTNMPAYLHYSKSDDRMNRIGDILLIPDWPYTFANRGRKLNPGAHGFNAYLIKDMHATFFAWGPAFKNIKIDSFENVNVYPVISAILGLPYSFKIDGTPALAKQILKIRSSL